MHNKPSPRRRTSALLNRLLGIPQPLDTKGRRMKVKIGVLASSMPALAEFANISMPPKQALSLRRVLKAARAELETFSAIEKETAEKHNAVIKVGPNGTQYYDLGTPEAMKAFNEELKPARDVEVDLPGAGFTEADLETLKEVKPAVLDALEWLFV